MSRRMSLLLLLFLSVAGASAERPLYQVMGTSNDGALLRQTKNDDALKLSGRYMDLGDCHSKVGNMNQSPFTFYRGSNQLFFRDMNNQKTVLNSAFYDEAATPWLQGDMHLLNAGRFDNGDGTVVYDVNDFDESFVANYLYDVYRCAASIVLVARNNSMSNGEAADCVKTFAAAYRGQLKKLAKGDSSPFTLDLDKARGVVRNLLMDKKGGELGGNKDQDKMRKKMLDKWAPEGDGEHRMFNRSSDNFEPILDKGHEDTIREAFKVYYKETVDSSLKGNKKYFKIQDIALRKNAGTGSLGTDRYYILIAGNDPKDPDDDRILDVKRQGKPAVYTYLSADQRKQVDDVVANDADRAVQAYKALVSRADEHLGYLEMFNGFYSVRERSPYKKALVLEGIDVDTLEDLAEQYGVMLANAHARSSKQSKDVGVPKSFAQMVADKTRGRKQEFMDEVAHVATEYGAQVEHDFNLFLDSEASGKLCQKN